MLVDKKLADSEGFIEHGPPVSLNPIIAARGLAPVVLGEDAPTLVGVKEFTYTYQCKHCGHMWSEIHDATRDAKAPPGYTGD